MKSAQAVAGDATATTQPTAPTPTGASARPSSRWSCCSTDDERRAERLLHLPLPGLRGLPARLLLPAAAAGRLHPGPAGRRDDVAAAAPVPRDQRVRSRCRHLPRGCALPGLPDQPSPGPGRRAQGGEVILTQAQVCGSCGYHHPREVGTDVCSPVRRRFGDADDQDAADAERGHAPPRADQRRRGGTQPGRVRPAHHATASSPAAATPGTTRRDRDRRRRSSRWPRSATATPPRSG